MDEQMKQVERYRHSEDFSDYEGSGYEESAIKKKSKRKKKNKRGVPFILVVCLLLLTFTAGMFMERYRMMSSENGLGMKMGPIFSKLSLLEDCVEKYYLYDTEADKLEDGIYHGFMNSLGDKYAAYFSPMEFKQMNDEDAGEYKGIGVSVTKNSTNGYAEIVEVFKGDPAYNAGIRAGDLIYEVNGKETTDMTLNEVVSEIKSSADPVKLTILRDGESMEFSVDKSNILITSVEYSMEENQIGLVSVSQFIDNTDEQFIKALDDLESQGMKGLVIDLRGNGGGSVATCLNMVSRIIPENDLIVYTLDKNENRQDYNSDSEKTLDVPIAILVDQYTASASEIMTGCLKDYSLATVIGQTTYGKGIVQTVLPLSDGSAMKFTISSYYTPSGESIHNKGIEPDETIVIPQEKIPEAMDDPSKDTQLQRAYEILRDAQSK